MPSIVIPAHNEERVIGRLLTGLTTGAKPGELDIVVVCNGCSDATADIAHAYGPDVRVLSLPNPSKIGALRRGDIAARGFPRLYVDADVELTTVDVRALCSAVGVAGTLAAAPQRVVPLAGSSAAVRAFYSVWQELPEVRAGLFGRGVIAVSEAGHQRIAELPECMSDDLFLAEAFAPDESTVVDTAHVVVHPPRTWADLMRRRTRAMAGNETTRRAGAATGRTRTTVADLLAVVRRHPALLPHMSVFIVATVVSRWRGRAARRTGEPTWLRDESSRLPGPAPLP